MLSAFSNVILFFSTVIFYFFLAFLVLGEEKKCVWNWFLPTGHKSRSILLLSYGTYLTFSLVRFFNVHPLYLKLPCNLAYNQFSLKLNTFLFLLFQINQISNNLVEWKLVVKIKFEWKNIVPHGILPWAW